MLKASLIQKLAWETLTEAAASHAQHQKITNEVWGQLNAVFGGTLSAATELLENCKITQYQTSDKSRSVFKVGPQSDRYTIYNDINFCQCRDFKTHVLEQSEITCRHVLAFQLNKITGAIKVRTETVSDSQLVEFLNEQLVAVNEDESGV